MDIFIPTWTHLRVACSGSSDPINVTSGVPRAQGTFLAY